MAKDRREGRGLARVTVPAMRVADDLSANLLGAVQAVLLKGKLALVGLFRSSLQATTHQRSSRVVPLGAMGGRYLYHRFAEGKPLAAQMLCACPCS